MGLPDTFGWMFVGMFFVILLHGMVLLLGMQYFRYFIFSDKLSIKLTASLMLVIGALHAIAIFAWVYKVLISNFGMPFEVLDLMPPISLVQTLCVSVLAFISQCFFGTKIWILSENLVLSTPVFLLAFLQLGIACAQITRAIAVSRLSRLPETNTLVTVEQSVIAACDSMITVVLCGVLHKNRLGLKATDTLIKKLIVYAISRGVVTSLLAILTLILFLCIPKTMIFMISFFPTGQLYIINVLGSLLLRSSLRNNLKGAQNVSEIDFYDLAHAGSMTRPQYFSKLGNNAPDVEGGVDITISVASQDENNHSQDIGSSN